MIKLINLSIAALLLFCSFNCIAEESTNSKEKQTTIEEKNNAMLPRWDLTDFYESYKSKELKEDLAEMERQVSKFSSKYEGKIEQLPAEELHKAIVEYEKIDELMAKVGSYSSLLYSTNLNNPEILVFFQNTNEYITSLSSKLLFFQLELNNIKVEAIEKLLQHDGVKYYKPWLDKIRSFKPYQLSEKEEKILHEKSITANNYWVKLFETTITTLRFPYQGKELTYAEILEKPLDADEKVRKEAYFSITSTLNKNIELFSLITNALAKDKAIDDDIRKAPSITTFRNLGNQVEDEVVNALVSTVKANYSNLAQRYYLMKAKWMGKEKLDPWDRNAPLPDSLDKYIPWDKAKEIVLKSYSSFSPEFAALAQKFFDNNWIDAQVYEGKTAGAYSDSTVPSVHPYILMNYQGKEEDVMTLAHELGHGVHQLLGAKVGNLMANTPLTLAETASLFGEQLVFEYLMSIETNLQKRKSMLAKKIDDSLNTIVRQITFHEFEFRVHTARKQGELTSEQISNIWQDVTKECFGDSVNYREESGSLWSGIPHFIRSPFYVYAYAFGNCSVNSLYGVYNQGEVTDFVPKYLDLLSAGGSKKHKELLAPFGLDANDPSFWQKGLDVVSKMIDELEKMK